ncbi:MAG: hypothetical protein KatS3mg111_2159 [Pirellulaceae bacterium]|nr:MAG: hypothetical protein KatS3mg111_2159 [Pirellulaceae bacterium]
MAFLTPTGGSQFGRRIELNRAETVFGRHPACDVVLEAGPVSRHHARIVQQSDGHYVLEDLQSRNGTLLNGQRVVNPTTLHDGDLITICDFEYLFHDEQQQGDARRFQEHLSEGSSLGVVLIDDGGQRDASRSVQRKLDVRKSSAGTQLTSSAEMRLHAVLSIARNLAGAIKLDEVLPKLLNTLFEIFLQADRAFIVLQEGEQLVPKWNKTRTGDPQQELRISRTVIREVMESKEAIISLDASADSRFQSAMSIADFSIRSIIVAPLIDSAGNALGALQIDTLDARRQFSHDDLEVLAGIATQAGIAIEKARLHEQLIHQQQVEQDLRLARSVQEAFLPQDYPQVPGWQFYSYYHPAEQIGGDYYDFIPLADGTLAVVVADVAGHGVAAAMLMAKLSAEVRYLLASSSDPAAAVNQLNKRLARLSVEKFVTLLCVIIDPRNGQCTLVNAAHMLPLWVRADGELLEPGHEESGLPLGVFDDAEYSSSSLQLAPGDRLVLYTDGINEAMNLEGKMFGIPRLKKAIAQHRGTLVELGRHIMDSVHKFCGRARQNDDMCLVLIQRDGDADRRAPSTDT